VLATLVAGDNRPIDVRLALLSSGAGASNLASRRWSGRVSDIRVLVVDDQPIYRAALTGLLEVVGGYTVVAEAETGEQAIERARTLEVDLVLMDLRLPGMDGYAATQVITALGNAPEVVVISTDVDALSPAVASQSGALTTVAKADLDPEWLSELRARLRRAHPRS